MSGHQFHRNVFLIAAVVYMITAWNSSGYHSADEHFQIIAFAQWKLGELPAEHLAWEFDAGIRSSLQPWIAVVVFQTAAACGSDDPFTRTLMLRLLTAVLALLAVRGFARATSTTLDQRWHSAYIIVAYLLWFLPFLHVRFSSEGWAGIFLLFMFTAMLQRGKAWAVQTGLSAGIAVLCRPPTGSIVLSAVTWMLLVRKDHRRSAGLVGAGALSMLFIGLLLDNAFYGSFTPTTWNYLRLGFIGDPAHQFDELPWYYYPPWIIKYALPPIGALIIAALVVLAWKHPKHLVVWCALPYLLVHTVIAHKELRFLYPLAALAPWALISAWALWHDTAMMKSVRLMIKSVAVICILANILGLAVVMTSPAGEGRVVLAKKLHEEVKPGETIGYLVEPELAWRIALPAFYHPPGAEEVAFPTTATSGFEHVDFLVARPAEADAFAQRQGLALKAMATTERPWTAELIRRYTWNEGTGPWTLYRVENGR